MRSGPITRIDPPASHRDSHEGDAVLVARARDGDGSAFTVLVRRHLPAAFAVARSVLIERADAEDACQDAFLSAFTRLRDCQPPDRFRSWILAIARNRALSLLRWRRVRDTEVLGSAAGESDVAAKGESPADAAERADLRARLLTALATLSDAQRTAVILHDVDGWIHRDIAAVLGVAHGTSRSILFGARQRLRVQLASAGDAPVPLASQAGSQRMPGTYSTPARRRSPER